MPSSSHTGFHSAIDVGATKVCVVVCRSSGRGLEIVGHGVAAQGAAGSTHAEGAEPDLCATQSAVREAVGIAERRSRLRIGAACASIAQARGAGLGLDENAARSAAEREALVLSIESAGVSITDVVPSSIACSEAALTDAERQRGVVLLDIGARTTDLVVYADDAVTHSEVIEFGGMTLTAALASRFGISLTEAEFLKRNAGLGGAMEVTHGTRKELGGASSRGAPRRVNTAQLVLPGFDDPRDAFVAVPNCKRGEGKAIRRSELELVIESRLERLWAPIRRSLEAHAADGGGLVLTGGATLLQGFVAQAELKLGRTVRRASPFGIEGLPDQLHSPAFATAVGLALWSARNTARQDHRPTWGRRRLASA